MALAAVAPLQQDHEGEDRVGLRCKPPMGEESPVWHWSRRAQCHRGSAKALIEEGSFQAAEVRGFSRWPWRLAWSCMPTSSRVNLRCKRPSLSRGPMSQFRKIASRIQAQKVCRGKNPKGDVVEGAAPRSELVSGLLHTGSLDHGPGPSKWQLAGFGPRARFRRLGSLAGLSSMEGVVGAFLQCDFASRLETAYGCAGAVHQSGSTRWGLPSKRSWGVSTTVHRLLRVRSQKTAYVRKMVLPLSSPAVGCDPSLSSLQCTLTRVLPTH